MKELTRKTTYESNSLGLYPQTNLNIWATIRKHVVVNRKTTGQKDMHSLLGNLKKLQFRLHP